MSYLLSLVYTLLIFFSIILLILLACHFDKSGMLKPFSWYRPSFRRKCAMLPTTPQNMIFGKAFTFWRAGPKGVWNFFQDMIDHTGDIGYFHLFGAPYVYLASVEAIGALLSDKHCINKGREYRTLVPWLGEGLLTNAGSKWHFRRKLITPAFHFKILEKSVPIFNKNAKLLVKKLMVYSIDPTSPVDIGPLISTCALATICETTMGSQLDFQSEECLMLVAAIHRATEISVQRGMTIWMYLDSVFYCLPLGREYKKVVGQIHAFTDKIIKERKENYKPQNESTILSAQDDCTNTYKENNFLLDRLIEYQRQNQTLMTDEDIREEVNTFIFAGHDTVSTAIIWALFAIATHPDVQIKIQEELNQIFGSSLRDISLQDVNEMHYLERVFKETLRLYPSGSFFAREIGKDLQLKDHCIPAGTEVMVFPYLLHRDPRYYPEPEKFDPDRFLPDVMKGRPAYAYLPFSAGFRNCIGQKYATLEVKIVLATILRTLSISTTLKKEDVAAILDVVLRSDPKITLSFSPIDRR